MSKNILIVENDAALSRAMKDQLVARGFEVAETADGKGCAELIRRTKPNLVVLAVDLAAGQNGYIICKKLKSDDELKPIPVIIVGNPDGFGQHKKLKTHADDYLGKPFDPQVVIDRAGALIGLPDLPEQESVEDGSMNLNELIDDKKEETVGNGDPDFEMVDAMFDEKTAGASALTGINPKAQVDEEIKSAEFQVEEDTAVPLVQDEESTNERTIVGMMPSAPPPPPPASTPPASARPSAGEAGETRTLKSRVTELTGSLEESKRRAEELDEKVRELESKLETKQSELDSASAKPSGGKADSKELFALKDQVNKKDKEILRLKNELNEKEKEVVDLHEKETAFEQKLSDSSDEIDSRDAQIKTLTSKADQLSSERKKVDQQLTTAKEETRATAAQLATLQTDFDGLQSRSDSMETELGTLRIANEDAENTKQTTETARQELETKLAELTGEHEALKSSAEEREREIEDVRAQLETATSDLDSAKSQVATQATAFAEEMGGLRKKLNDLEDVASKNESRIKALVARIKSEELVRERTRESLQQALSALEEQPSSSVEELMSDDDIAEA